MKIEIYRANGVCEEHNVGKHNAIDWISKQIGAEMLDTVNLRDGRIMLVDDTGLVDGRPKNEKATQLYHSVCHKGTTAPICGDVAVAVDEDFA